MFTDFAERFPRVAILIVVIVFTVVALAIDVASLHADGFTTIFG
jgi:hypothetical protein